MRMFTTLRELLGLRKKNYSECMIVTEQEGAEIWLNGENTFRLTPSLIKIEANKPAEITLRLTGHETHFAEIFSDNPLSFYYTNLERIPLRLISTQDTYEHSL